MSACEPNFTITKYKVRVSARILTLLHTSVSLHFYTRHCPYTSTHVSVPKLLHTSVSLHVYTLQCPYTSTHFSVPTLLHTLLRCFIKAVHVGIHSLSQVCLKVGQSRNCIANTCISSIYITHFPRSYSKGYVFVLFLFSLVLTALTMVFVLCRILFAGKVESMVCVLTPLHYSLVIVTKRCFVVLSWRYLIFTN